MENRFNFVRKHVIWSCSYDTRLSAHQFVDIFTQRLPTQLYMDFRDTLSIWIPYAPTEGVLNVMYLFVHIV